MSNTEYNRGGVPGTEQPVYTLLLRVRVSPESGEDEVAVAHRLRRLLKGLLRGYGFRCLSIAEEKQQ